MGSGAGAGWVMSGALPTTRVLAEEATTSAASDDLGSVTGAAGDGLGSFTRAAGDVTGDGLPDLLLAAYSSDTAGTDAGEVLVVSSSSTGVTTSATLRGSAGEKIGFALAGVPLPWRDDAVGDVSGDGIGDLVVGSPFARADLAGSVYVFFGPVSGTLATSDANADILGTRTRAQAAYDASILGDVDGDGIAELAVRGDYTSTATVQIFEGPITERSYLASSTYAWATLTATNTWDWLKPSGVGDVDDDGYADFGVGVSNSSTSYFFTGGPSLADTTLSGGAVATWAGPASSSAGWAIAGAGDIDCDGGDDVLVGAPLGAGQACLMIGPFGGAMSCDATLVGAGTDAVGSGAAGIGDLDGRGCEDLAIGAGGGSTVASGAGDLYLMLSE